MVSFTKRRSLIVDVVDITILTGHCKITEPRYILIIQFYRNIGFQSLMYERLITRVKITQESR